MKYSIDKTSTESACIQWYTQIRRDIGDGVFKYGVKLPSKRLLAEETGVSVITVEHAYAILCDEGYAEARMRSGYYVIYREGDLTSVVERTREQNLRSMQEHKNEFPFSVLAKTMRKVLSDYGERILIKSPNHGCMELTGYSRLPFTK